MPGAIRDEDHLIVVEMGNPKLIKMRIDGITPK